MNITLHVWRQESGESRGRMVVYDVEDVNPHMSFLEMLDVLNERLETAGEEPIAFDHDCREGICGSCGMMINGRPHGGLPRTTVCQLHMRHFKDGDVVFVEPWRARAFAVQKDLMVDRSALDRVIESGGYISVNTGSAPEANGLPVAKENQELAMDAAACIGCGACVAACPNGSAMLFTASKVAHLSLLPQGRPELERRVRGMTAGMDQQLFGACSNFGECQEACPKGISLSFIGMLYRLYLRSSLLAPGRSRGRLGAQ